MIDNFFNEAKTELVAEIVLVYIKDKSKSTN